MKASILVIDDDESIAKVTLKALGKEGFQTNWAKTADQALAVLKTKAFDAALLDIQLPGISGLKLLEILKSDPKTASLPVILLTVLGGSKDKVTGLESGADDYLAKPFSTDELCARVKALLRRSRTEGRMANVLQSGSICVDLDRQTVSVKNREVPVTATEFKLLTIFLRRPEYVLTYEILGEAISQDTGIVASGTLYAHVMNLRRKLGSAGDAIETVRGIGYKFVPN